MNENPGHTREFRRMVAQVETEEAAAERNDELRAQAAERKAAAFPIPLTRKQRAALKTKGPVVL